MDVVLGASVPFQTELSLINVCFYIVVCIDCCGSLEVSLLQEQHVGTNIIRTRTDIDKLIFWL